MKAKAPYILLIIFAGIIIFLYFSKPSGHKQEVERLRKRQESLTDSALQVVEFIRDSAKVALAETERAHLERLKTTEERILSEKKHSQVIHVRTRRDSERDSVLRELYPSFKVNN